MAAMPRPNVPSTSRAPRGFQGQKANSASTVV